MVGQPEGAGKEEEQTGKHDQPEGVDGVADGGRIRVYPTCTNRNKNSKKLHIMGKETTSKQKRKERDIPGLLNSCAL